MRALALALALLAAVPLPAAAERVTLGYGRLFTNDYFGDGHDRWRAGSYQFSVVRGPEGHPGGPGAVGEIIEYRFRSEIISPQVGRGAGGERPYVGALTFGVHSHSAHGPAELTVGAEAVLVGPQTGLSDAQRRIHDRFDLSGPFGYEDQLEDDLLFSGLAEVALPLRLSGAFTLRPFAEVQTGQQDSLRLGADMIWGAVGHEDVLIRDAVTGQMIRGTEAPVTGVSFVAGADWTQIGNDAFLPDDRGVEPEEVRLRARSGVHWQLAPKVSFFGGVTWLSEEFEDQHEPQVLGSMKLNFNY